MAECGLPVAQAVWRSPASSGPETTSKSVTESSPRQVISMSTIINSALALTIILSAEAAPQLGLTLLPSLRLPGPDLHRGGRGRGGGGAGGGQPE